MLVHRLNKKTPYFIHLQMINFDFYLSIILIGILSSFVSSVYLYCLQPNQLLGTFGYYLAEEEDLGKWWVKPLGRCPFCNAYWIGFIISFGLTIHQGIYCASLSAFLGASVSANLINHIKYGY